jgi:hypothetical protein
MAFEKFVQFLDSTKFRGQRRGINQF